MISKAFKDVVIKWPVEDVIDILLEREDKDLKQITEKIKAELKLRKQTHDARRSRN